MSAYQTSTSGAPTELGLAGNEGVGPGMALLAELAAADPELLRCYPSADALRAALADWLKREPSEVLLTAGGDEGLDRVCRWALRAGGRALLPWPGFEMTRRYLELNGAVIDQVAWTAHRFPIEAALRALRPDTRLIVVTSPNNPTGGVATAADLERLAAAAPQAVLLVDLAYAEFAEEDLTAAALRLPNAVVVRTFSKAWGLAGCRVGYLLSDPATIRALAGCGGPYPVAGPSLALATQRLLRDEPAMRAGVQATRSRRDRLSQELASLGWRPYRSEANFVCCAPPEPLQARDALAGMGIATRAWPDQEGLQDLLRISCPSRDTDQERLLRALQVIARPQALLFDLDGVLADVSQSYRQSVLATAASFGVSLTPEEVQAAKERGGLNNDWELTHRLLAERGQTLAFDQVKTRFEALYQGTEQQPGLRRHERVLGGTSARAALFRLARRLPLALVTGRPRADALRFLDEQELRPAFATVVAMEDAPNKPAPDPLLLALRELGVARAWMVGDTVDDVRAARAADCLPIGFRAPAAPLIRAGAAWVLDSLTTLESRLS